MDKEISKTLWELFEQTGQVGLYNLFNELDKQDE